MCGFYVIQYAAIENCIKKFSSLIKLYERFQFTATIYINNIFLISKWHTHSSFCGSWNLTSYDMPHQFHKKQGWGLILSTHIFLTKNVSNLIRSYLLLSALPLTFHGKCCSHLWDYFHASTKMSDYHILQFWNVSNYYLVIHSLSWAYQDTIEFLSQYYQNTINYLIVLLFYKNL